MDYVLLQLGNPGRYQLFIGFLLCCLQIPISFSGHLWSFYMDDVPHRCFIPSWQRNGSNEAEWIPRLTNDKTGTTEFASCEMYIDPFAHWKGTTKCSSGWEYRPYEGQHNPIVEWNLVCDRSYFVTLLFYVSLISSIVGGLMIGIIADRFERKSALLLALYLFVAIAFSMHFVQDIISFGVAFCLQNFFLTGIQIASYVLLMEIMPSPYQFQASVYYAAFAIVSSMVVPLIMWLISSWRYIQLAISAPGVVFFAHLWYNFTNLLILPRSPLWLISEGKMVETENLMENLGKQNGKSMPPSFRLHLQNFLNLIKSCDGLSRKRHNIWSQFSSPSLLLRLHQTKHTDYFYRGLMDLGAVTLIYHVSMRFGPRSIQSLLFILSGLLMMIAISLEEFFPVNPNRDGYEYQLLLIPSTLVSGARTLLMTLPIFIWYHTIKTLPTGIRAIGFACCFGWGIVGRMSAPNLLVLVSQPHRSFHPIGLCGSLSMIAGGLSLLFPDFWRKPLPNTLSDVENRSSPQTTISRSSISGFRQIKSINSNYMKNSCDIGICGPIDPKTEAKLIMQQNLNQENQLQQHQFPPPDCYYEDELGLPIENQLTCDNYNLNMRPSNVINSQLINPDSERMNPRSSMVISEAQSSQITEIDDINTIETNRSFRDLQIFPNSGTLNCNNVIGSAIDDDETSAVVIIENSVSKVSETKL
uniref:Major facilitator superfamily (MFS) profile domain-containing protein n=1 Tax=Tetranychus urticae TaxID=32264 RepID=T1L1N6_TETUR